MITEQYTRNIINNNLKKKNWILDKNNQNCNVFQEEVKTIFQKETIKKERLDYVLYQTGTDDIIAIIEAKRGSQNNLKKALEQATKYAQIFGRKKPIIIFATNGYSYEARIFPSNKILILNNENVKDLLTENMILKFIESNTNIIKTIPNIVEISKQQLITIFKNLNNVLRSEGLKAGIERFNEFSNILFLKLLSENNTKHKWWEIIKKTPDEVVFTYINNKLIKEINTIYKGNIFTTLLIKKTTTLRHIINAIDPLIFSQVDTDIKGDAFEYFIEKATSTNNDLGEYFTPRHIVKGIIDVVKPKFNEKIYDPFCGTGGFLISAFNCIKQNIILNKKHEYNLKNHTLYGNEITTTAKIAKMNMILHGDGHSGIKQCDSFLNPIDKKYDLIITNIPFRQQIETKLSLNGKTKKINNISPLYYNGLAKKNGDAVCVLHCLRALKEDGRMAIIVPEGFLFNKNLASVRKFLLNNANLKAIISLPRGTFLPYTGVKTNILYFINAHNSKSQKEYWYYEVKNTGYSLDNNKRKIHGFNDFDTIQLVIDNLIKAEKDKEIKNNLLQEGFKNINLQKVKKNNYILMGNYYEECFLNTTHGKRTLYELIKDNIIVGKRGQTITKNTAIKGNIPVIAGGKNIPYFHNKFNFSKNIITISASGSAGFIWYHNYPIWASDCSVLYSQDKSKLITKYLYYVLKSQQKEIYKKQHGTSQLHVYLSDLMSFKVLLPSLRKQEEIIKDIEAKEKMIQQSKKLIETYEKRIEDKLKLLR